MKTSDEFSVGQRVVIDDSRYGDRVYGTVVAPYEHEQPAYLVHRDGNWHKPEVAVLAVQMTPARAARDMDIGDLLNLDMLKAAIEVPFLGSLWTEGDSGMMTPHVCKASFGDGMYLLTISTIHQRPNYWVMRVDSSWREARHGYHWFRESSVGDHIDDVLAAIEEECGRAGECLEDPCDNCDDTTCKCSDDYSADKAFPELDDRYGCSWGHIRWDWLMRAIDYQAISERLAA